MKISGALEGYSITNQAENKSSQTIAAARWHVSKFAAWLSSQDDGAPIQLPDVTPQSFRAFLQHESQRGLRPHSVHAHHKCISTFLRWCIREELIQHDPLTYDKSKCVGHLLRRCHTVVESGNARAIRSSEQAACLFRGALKLKERKATWSTHGYRLACGRLAACDRLLARSYRQADTVRFVQLLRKQRAYLFTFLYVDAVAPTNNAAERELRPAVIIRKTNGCNRSPKGATAHATLSSIIRTARKHSHDFVDLTRRVLQQPMQVGVKLCSSDPAPPIGPVPTTHPAPDAASATGCQAALPRA